MGYGPNKTKMISFIKENNLTDKIRIINFKENPYNYIKYADVFILTSNFEGLPNVLLESICLKKIIISTDCPTGPNEILKKGKFGSLVKINDTKKLSRLLLNIDKSKKKYKDLAIKGFNSLERFSFTANMNRYLSIVNKFLKD